VTLTCSSSTQWLLLLPEPPPAVLASTPVAESLQSHAVAATLLLLMCACHYKCYQCLLKPLQQVAFVQLEVVEGSLPVHLHYTTVETLLRTLLGWYMLQRCILLLLKFKQAAGR